MFDFVDSSIMNFADDDDNKSTISDTDIGLL